MRLRYFVWIVLCYVGLCCVVCVVLLCVHVPPLPSVCLYVCVCMCVHVCVHMCDVL